MKRLFIFFAAVFVTGMMMVAPVPDADAQFSDTHHLLNAVEDNDIGGARERLFNGANPNSGRDGDSAMIMALRLGYYDMMRVLLDSGARVNTKTEDNENTAVAIAASTGDEAAIAILLEYNADLNMPDRQGRTPLMKAASSRKTRLARILIENGANIYATDYTGRDALDYAKDSRARGVVKVIEDAIAEN